MDIFLLIVIILFVVAALDLIVGVSNDAVNFLNSAIGSKVAPFKTIMVIATLGILAGSFSSSGLMEVARKGVFDPSMFTYESIMFLFLAVMLTDIILLDFFNEIGMPTSTTVSIVFELLGAATMIAFLLIAAQKGGSENMADFIKVGKAMKIVGGIFSSILIAFTLGAVVQFFSRWALTFNYQHKLDSTAPIFAGLAITAITYFLFVKGIKSTPFAKTSTGEETQFYHYIKNNIPTVVGILFAFWTLLNFILKKVANVNPLKTVVLAGTFALAMAFAGNDLVNFIGVPIGAFQSYGFAQESGLAANEMLMTRLNEAVEVPLYLLGLSGLIMAITLWTSSKARKVTETEINLARQDEGEERFKPNFLANGIVKLGETIGKGLEVITPIPMKTSIKNSYVARIFTTEMREEDKPAFDLIRASVNLMMASIVISYATFKKMPLSTTYVSFMVAMGTSLADKAWGRESAPYRVAGVLNVIGGWLMTALIAFTAAAIFAFILFKLKLVGIILVVALAIFALIRSHFAFKRKEKALAEARASQGNH